MNHFYFAVPRNADLATREAVPEHIAREYGVKGPIEFVREEPAFRLYRIQDNRK